MKHVQGEMKEWKGNDVPDDGNNNNQNDDLMKCYPIWRKKGVAAGLLNLKVLWELAAILGNEVATGFSKNSPKSPVFRGGDEGLRVLHGS